MRTGTAENAALATVAYSATAMVATGTVATGGDPGMAMLALFPSLVVLAATGLAERKASEISTWLRRVFDGVPGRTGEEVKALVEERLRVDPSAQRAVIGAARALLEADACVTESIAALSRPYLTEEMRVDGFFRGMLEVLTAVSPEELEELRVLFANAATLSSVGSLQLVWAHDDDGPNIRIWYAPNVTTDFEHTTFPLSKAEQLLRLLRRADITSDPPDEPSRSYISAGSDSEKMLRWSRPAFMPSDLARRIHLIVRY